MQPLPETPRTPESTPVSSPGDITPVHVRTSRRLQGLQPEHGFEPEEISVWYSLWVGDDATNRSSITVWVPRNATVFDAMKAAARKDSRFRFEYDTASGLGPYVLSLSGVLRDMETGHFWLAHTMNFATGLVTPLSVGKCLDYDMDARNDFDAEEGRRSAADVRTAAPRRKGDAGPLSRHGKRKLKEKSARTKKNKGSGPLLSWWWWWEMDPIDMSETARSRLRECALAAYKPFGYGCPRARPQPPNNGRETSTVEARRLQPRMLASGAWTVNDCPMNWFSGARQRQTSRRRDIPRDAVER
ncbi:hypothetical protein HPB50_013893 [Hyalomma asiaticum]|uniref:Uncharacterized protein n=1 Tax=Hyalomma asiaticum TaxID=266040 RepID=A0ACB7TK01_HYAAI|nr:hypothetical protein HPB50_013893 [Hyalomma asiaticum]